MPLNSVTATGGPSGNLAVGPLTPQNFNDVAFVVISAYSDFYPPSPQPLENTVLQLSSCANASGGNTVYTGTITGGAGDAFANLIFYVAHMNFNQNQGWFLCVASTNTTLTLANPNGIAVTDNGTATNGWVGGLGDSGSFNWMQICNSTTPLTFTLPGIEINWAALMVTIPSLGVEVQVPNIGTGWSFGTSGVPSSTDPFTVAAGQAVIYMMGINNEDVGSPYFSAIYGISDTLGNTYEQVFVGNPGDPSYPYQQAAAWFLVAFASPGGSDTLTGTCDPAFGQNGIVLTVTNLFAPGTPNRAFGSLFNFGGI
jgi:hypothetical protein